LGIAAGAFGTHKTQHVGAQAGAKAESWRQGRHDADMADAGINDYLGAVAKALQLLRHV
jgi:hypothetical protein